MFCGQRVLILRNFRGEYIFPKGHIEADEDELQAALREVKEEAGITPKSVVPTRQTAYKFRTKDGECRYKTVYWFIMTTDQELFQVDGHEIKWGAFLNEQEARELLTHQLDRELLAHAARQLMGEA